MVDLIAPDYHEQLKLREYEHFSLYLYHRQNYLGWCNLRLNRPGIVDMHDMIPPEQKEYFMIARDVKYAIKGVFHNDRFDDESYGKNNGTLRMHVIPRYQEPREFEGMTFVDHNWGRGHSPYDKKFYVPQDVLLKIKDTIDSRLRKPRF